MKLSVKIGDMTLKNPVMVASGTFGYGQEASDFLDLSCLGGIITKSVTLKPRAGNPPPRICELPGGMLNSIGLANVGLERFIEEKLPFLRGLNTQLIVNIAGGVADEFGEVLERLDDESGIAAYELNFSCPNVKEGGLEFSQNANVLSRVTRKLRKITKRPLIVKLTPNVSGIGSIARAAEESGADAISAINTVLGFAVDIEQKRPRIYRGLAGYSGPAIKPIALAKVYEAAQNVNIPIIGIGGIKSGEDALEFIITGATAVQIGAANFIDPRTSEFVLQGILEYGARHGVDSIASLIGSLKPWQESN